MGVTGLWRLIDASGKPVPLESLQGKVLAIDVSIWIHQVLQGYQDHHGNPKPNAHLIGLFNRICKLLYYKIKPVFVFDGGVPMLKKHTIAARKKQKALARNKAEQMKIDLLTNLVKHKVVKTALNTETSDEKDEAFRITSNIASKNSLYDIFKLPDSTIEASLEPKSISDDDSDSDNSIIISPKKQNRWLGNIHDVNVNTLEFKSLPPDVRYDILTDLKETRKQNSWGRLSEMPEESHEFSSFQMKRLMKRRYVQEALESAEKEMGGKTLTLVELDKLLTEQGIKTVNDKAYRIASDSTTRIIYISDKDALVQNASQSSTTAVDSSRQGNPEPVAGPSGTTSTKKKVYEYRLSDRDSDSEISLNSPMAIAENIDEYEFDSDWESELELNKSRPLSKKYFGKLKDNMNPALIYMLEHSDLTQEQILQLIEQNQTENSKEKIIKNKQTSSGRQTPNENSTGNKNREEIEYKDKSGLSQEQTLQLIEQNGKESQKVNTEEKMEILSENQMPEEISIEDKVSEETIFQYKFDESKDSTMDVYNSVQQIEEVNSNVQSVKETEYVSKSNETKNSSFGISNLDDSVEIIKHVDSGINSMISNNNEISEDEKIDQKRLSPFYKDNSVVESDSDSDNFIEIPDVFVPPSSALKSYDTGHNIEITLNSTDKVEDDIFADIFNDLSAHNQKISSSNADFPSFESGNIFKRSLETISEEVIGDKSMVRSDEIKGKELEEETTKRRADEKENKKIEKEKKEEEIQIIQSNADNKTNIMNKQPERNEINSNTMITTSEFQVSNETQNSKVEPIVLLRDKDELLSLKEHLENEQKELEGTLGKLERQATDISEQISLEAQELLRLFGIPYIVAPMEAEAQCAYLEQIKLTDGSITDDSDIWLFGGQCVYKNFFAHDKKVLQFCLSDIQHHFNLSRHQMIQLALLLGSDYTTGVPGIGPVTALEILAAFPSHADNLLHGLINFCAWMNENGVRDASKRTLRNKLRNVKIEKGFPSQAVVQAYLFPSVDESREGFTWGKPNPVLLADYTSRKFGWSRNKFEVIMKPVFKKMEERGSQKFIEDFFKYYSVPKSIEITMSKRVQKAVQRLHNGNAENKAEEEKDKNIPKKVRTKEEKKQKEEENNEKKEGVNKSKKARTISKKKEEEENNEEKEGESKPKRARKVSKKKGEVKEGVDVPKTMNAVMLNERPIDTTVSNEKSKIVPASIYDQSSIKKEVIPQREKDKANALKNRLRAVEVLRKSRSRKSKPKRRNENLRKIMKEADLSESSGSS